MIFMIKEGKILYDSFVEDTQENRSEFAYALVPEA
jgi:hypothetical protein